MADTALLSLFSFPAAIQFTLAFIVLAIGSYTDFKTREVPDWINLGLVGAGFGLNAIFSAIYWDAKYIIASAAGFAVLFSIAWVMFYTGQWGGGDSKILMGLGAIIGIDIFSKNFFLLSFLINSLAVGAIYGLVWSFAYVAKNRKKFVDEFEGLLEQKNVKEARRDILACFCTLILIIVLVQSVFLKLALFYIALVLMLVFYLWAAVKSVETACMLKYVKPMELTEGDWIAKDIRINGKYITGPKDLGIEKKNIKKLIEFYKKGKIKNVLIKIGIPFVPSFFIAYAITLIYGNLIFVFL